MFRLFMTSLVALPPLLLAPQAMANQCEDAAKKVKREAKQANLDPAEFEKVDNALKQALDRRKTGDDMGCLSMVEAAKALFKPR
jgi:hypothetical protein